MRSVITSDKKTKIQLGHLSITFPKISHAYAHEHKMNRKNDELHEINDNDEVY